MRTRLLIVTVMVFFFGRVQAQTYERLFENGNEAYRNGEYRTAVQFYDSILARGVMSAHVYYNLGNARYRAGDLSGAILAYERAVRLDPTDGDVRHNLRLAYSRTQDRIDPLPELFLITWVRWLNATLPVRLTTVLFLAGWVMLFGSLVLLYLVRSGAVIRTSRISFFAGSALAVVFGILLVIQTTAIPEAREGIVRAATVTTKSSPDDLGSDAFVIHEGLKVSLGDSVDGWVRITLADGKTGWIRKEAVEAI